MIRSLRSAFAFLSRIPVGPWPLNPDLAGIAVWLPIVGLVIGGLTGLAFWGLTFIFPPLLSAVFALIFWVLCTGGLHLDGVADCGDGMIPEVSRERRLEIMKDSRLGTFGALTLVFTLMIKASALHYFAYSHDFWTIFLPCLIAGMLSRSQLFLILCAPSARPGGMGEAFRKGTKLYHIAPATLLTLLAIYFWGMPILIATVAVLLMSSLLIWYAHKRLGGVTGDVFGLSVETAEWVVLISFCLKIS